MKTILIVDDMAIFREPIEAVLKREGYRTLCASNGAEGLAALSGAGAGGGGGGAVDLVLLDLGMPVMDGLTMLAHMREDPRLRNTPVVVLSAVADRSRVVEALKLGIRGYMLKSQFSLKQMLERINDHFRAPARDGPAPSTAPTPGRADAVPAQGGRPAHVGQASPAEDPAAALRSLKPLLSRAEVMKRVESCEQLKALSPAVSQVLRLTGNDRCSVEDVARAISQDHAIALKVLKLANSTVYTRGRGGEPVDSVHKAVVRIGMERIRQAVLNISVIERFRSGAFEQDLSTPQFWEHAIACGLIASELAHAAGAQDADSAFTMGLLHDIGRIIYAERLGESYIEVIRAARRLDLPLEQVETRMLLLNHADVMDSVLHEWRFPKDLINPIVLHHLSPGNARNAAPHQVAETIRLGLANRLAHALILGSSGNDTIYPIEEHCQAIRLEPGVIQRIEAEARQQTDDIKFAMLATSNGANWPQRRDQLRELLPPVFNPLIVSASPELDAYRIFCDQLGTGGDGPPNIAIVHIAAPRERTPLSNDLRAREAELAAGGGGGAGGGPLPLIVLSPGAKLGLDDSALAGRHVRALPTPLTAARLLAAIHEAIAPALRAAA